MNTIDIVLLIPVLIGLGRGLWSGLIQQLAGIIGVGVGVALGYLFNDEAVSFLHKQFEMTEEASNIVGFIGLFLGGFLIVQLAAKLISTGVSMAALGFVNRFLGGLFGAIKYTVFTVIVLTVFNRVNDSMNLVEKQKLEESGVYTAFSELSKVLWDYVPEEDFELDLNSVEDRLNAW